MSQRYPVISARLTLSEHPLLRFTKRDGRLDPNFMERHGVVSGVSRSCRTESGLPGDSCQSPVFFHQELAEVALAEVANYNIRVISIV